MAPARVTESFDNRCASITWGLDSWLRVALPMPSSSYASYAKNSTPSTKHFSWFISIWKRPSTVHRNMWSCQLFVNSALTGCWCISYRTCTNMKPTWVERSVWKLGLIKAHAGYYSLHYWKPCPWSFIMHDAPGVCRWPGHHIWRARGTGKVSNPLEV